MPQPTQLSIIISTYNSPDYLAMVLQALMHQSDNEFELVIADDGSADETKAVVESYAGQSPVNLVHAWHDDRGFRAAAARNHAVSLSKGDYLVFLDGDCLAFPDFVAKHRQCAEPNCMVRGSRVMLKEAYSRRVLDGEPLPSSLPAWFGLRLRGGVKRIGALIPIPHPKFRNAKKWYGVKTCNLGIWRKDFEAVNGFDERYVGWGHEDADLAVRLLRHGVKRKEGRSDVPVVHLWHPENDRSTLSDNENRLQVVIDDQYTQSPMGLDRYGPQTDTH